MLADNPLVYYRSAAQANGLLVNSGTGGVAYDGESKDLIEERSCALGSGSCASFNGTTSEITIRGQRIDFSAQRPFSFEAWYRLPVRLNDEKWHHLFDRSLPMEKPRVQLAITFHDAEGIGLERWANQADGPGYSGTKPNWDASWHHLVATYDGGMVALYLDGIASPKARHTASLPPFDAPLYVGRTYFGNYFRGIVDEIAVYETALSETRARVHYLAGVR